MNFYDNELSIKIVKANDWKEALFTAFPQMKEYEDIPDTLEEAKQFAFNCDCMIDVVEIENK